MKCGNTIEIVSMKTKVTSKLEKWKGKTRVHVVLKLEIRNSNATIEFNA
jgi:hypothetical protein